MDQTKLPFDIQYRILAEISRLDRSENAAANWGQILNFFCISRLWYFSLQDLLILHNSAYSLLRTSRKIGHLALERLIADYEASKEECSYTEQQTTAHPLHSRPRTYSAKQDPDHSDKDGPLRHDLKMCSRAAAYLGYLDSLQVCLDSETQDDLHSLLFSAIDGDRFPVVALLFDGGFVDLQAEATDAGSGDSVLGYAIQHHRVAITDFLLDRGASLNIRISAQSESYFLGLLSPVSFAAWSGNTEVLRVLLAHGVDIENSRRFNPRRAVDWPILRGDVEMVRLFIEYGIELGAADYREECWPLYAAVENDDFDMVKLLIEEGGPSVRVEPGGYTAEMISEVLDSCESEDLRQYLEPYLR